MYVISILLLLVSISMGLAGIVDRLRGIETAIYATHRDPDPTLTRQSDGSVWLHWYGAKSSYGHRFEIDKIPFAGKE